MESIIKSESLKAANQTAIYTIIGVDTYLGAHMMRHLEKSGQIVVGVEQNSDFCYDAQSISVADLDKIPEDMPTVDAEWIVICLDPCIGFENYTAKVKKIFDHLTEREFIGDICFFSSATICMPDFDKPVSEEAAVYTRNMYDLALATGENMLTAFSCSDRGYAVPHIMRIGVPYGDEIGMSPLPGFASQMIDAASHGTTLKIPMMGDAKRTLVHISDICEAVMKLMNSDNCPHLVNIPGEIKTIRDVGRTISEKYHVEFIERGLNTHREQDFFAGDQHLSGELFAEIVDFVPQYTFEKWLEQQVYA